MQAESKDAAVYKVVRACIRLGDAIYVASSAIALGKEPERRECKERDKITIRHFVCDASCGTRIRPWSESYELTARVQIETN